MLADTNGKVDAFRKDLQTGAVVRLSTGASGAQANAATTRVRMSTDGSRVVFVSAANGLVPGDTDGATDVLLRRLDTGSLTRISAAASQGRNQPNGAADISPSGASAVFATEDTSAGRCGQVWTWDVASATASMKRKNCMDAEAWQGFPSVFALNQGFAVTRRMGFMGPRDTVTVPRPGQAGSYQVSYDVDDENGMDVAGLGGAVVGNEFTGLQRTAPDGSVTTLPYGVNPALSDDARLVVFVDDGQIKTWDYRTGAVRLISQR